MTVPMRRPRIEVARATRERVDRMAAQDTWVTGRILIEGAGETQVTVPFPVLFGEKPLPILGGGELDAGDSVKRHNYPTANAIVIGWEMVGDRYKGARLAIKTTGRRDQRLFVSFAFVGVALSNASTEG